MRRELSRNIITYLVHFLINICHFFFIPFLVQSFPTLAIVLDCEGSLHLYGAFNKIKLRLVRISHQYHLGVNAFAEFLDVL